MRAWEIIVDRLRITWEINVDRLRITGEHGKSLLTDLGLQRTWEFIVERVRTYDERILRGNMGKLDRLEMRGCRERIWEMLTDLG
eukprot:151019-Amorphochlora_amoeboformis.AAC.2